jgi:hypothetical protein
MMRMLPRRASSSVWRSSSSPAGPISLKPAEITMAAFHAFLCAIVDDAGHAGRRRHDDGQIHLLGHLRDVLVGLDAQYARPLGIDGEDRAAERAADQVPENSAPHGVGGFGGADDRDGLGGEEHIEWLGAFLDSFTGWFAD